MLDAELVCLPLVANLEPDLDCDLSILVALVRKRRAWAECGSFTVTNPAIETKATMSSPYRLQPHDKWIVTRHVGGGDHGVTVMLPGPSTA